jgi:hypothetical protein
MNAPRRAAPRLPSQTIGNAVIWLLLGAFVYLAFNAVVSPKVVRAIVTEGNGTVSTATARSGLLHLPRKRTLIVNLLCVSIRDS